MENFNKHPSHLMIVPIYDGNNTVVTQYKVVDQQNSYPIDLFYGTYQECLTWELNQWDDKIQRDEVEMTALELEYFNVASEILKKFGPEDCYAISNKIKELVDKDISEACKQDNKLSIIDVVGGGLKCDNIKCDWKDETIPFSDFKNWVNKPCPKCGENVLNLEDYNATILFLKITNTINELDIPGEGESIKAEVNIHNGINIEIK